MDTMICGPDGPEPEKTGNQEAQGNNNSGTAADERSQRHEHSKKTGIPSENDCLRAIAQMAGLAGAGIVEARPGQQCPRLLQGNPRALQGQGQRGGKEPLKYKCHGRAAARSEAAGPAGTPPDQRANRHGDERYQRGRRWVSFSSANISSTWAKT